LDSWTAQNEILGCILDMVLVLLQYTDITNLMIFDIIFKFKVLLFSIL